MMKSERDIKLRIEELKKNLLLARKSRQTEGAKTWIKSAIENLNWVLENGH